MQGLMGQELLGKVKLLDILDNLFQPGCYRITAFSGIRAVKRIKNNGFILVFVLKRPIAVAGGVVLAGFKEEEWEDKLKE